MEQFLFLFSVLVTLRGKAKCLLLTNGKLFLNAMDSIQRKATCHPNGGDQCNCVRHYRDGKQPAPRAQGVPRCSFLFSGIPEVSQAAQTYSEAAPQCVKLRKCTDRSAFDMQGCGCQIFKETTTVKKTYVHGPPHTSYSAQFT